MAIVLGFIITVRSSRRRLRYETQKAQAYYGLEAMLRPQPYFGVWMTDDPSPRSDRFWGLSLQQQNDRGEIDKSLSSLVFDFD